MSSEEIKKQFTEKRRIIWDQMLEKNNLKCMDMVSEMFDLFIDYGVQMFKDGLDKGEQIYRIKK